MFIISHDILGCIDKNPDRCSNDAHICYSNPAMRRSCPKTCGDCGEGILSLKIYMKPNINENAPTCQYIFTKQNVNCRVWF